MPRSNAVNRKASSPSASFSRGPWGGATAELSDLDTPVPRPGNGPTRCRVDSPEVRNTRSASSRRQTLVGARPQPSNAEVHEGLAPCPVGSSAMAVDRDQLDLDLDQSAVAAVRRWRFEPGHKDGQRLAVRVVVEMSFSLR